MDAVDVFISYASADRDWADSLDADLSEAGFNVSIDRERLVGAGEWPSGLDRIVASAQHFVLLWSRHAQQSSWVSREIALFEASRADSGTSHIIQVLLDDIPPYDSRFHTIAAHSDDPQLRRHVVEQLVAALKIPLDTGGDAGDLEDFAVVIGIETYPHLGNRRGAIKDAQSFAGWLTASSGGGLRPVNVESLIGGTSAIPAGPRPTRDDVERTFRVLVERARHGRPNAMGRRLYIYLSGLTAGASLDDLALLTAGASPDAPTAIAVMSYIQWFRLSGAFKEVVAFVDAGRIGDVRPDATLIPWTTPPVPPTIPAALFCVAAIPFVRARVEGTGDLTEASGFTPAVLEGLSGDAHGSDGLVSAESLSAYLRSRLTLPDNTAPHIIIDGSPIVFGRPLADARQIEDAPAAAEHVAAHADNPALIDELGRKPFAEVIAARIEEVRQARPSDEEQHAGAFIINLHGPWGAGKTSVLNFLKAHLQDPSRPPAQRWIVVEFNAWRHQRLQPPWWTLIKQIHAQAVKQLAPSREARKLRWRWVRASARADSLPSAVALILILTSIVLTTGIALRAEAPASPGEGTAKAIQLALGIVAAVLSTGAAVVAWSRSLVFGSAAAAQAYVQARKDPLGPIVELFQALVSAVGRPLVVFIDDLDRCDGTYVVELLEGIQTLFRRAPVTYVVAADRKWICACFEKKYADFTATIGEPGRPLGYLFLDKVFQVSASVPRLSADVQRRYWAGLLRTGRSTAPQAIADSHRQAEARAQIAVKGATTHEELTARIAEAGDDPVEAQAMRAAAAKQITSPEAMRETEHRLQPFASLLEPNPRAMKRLVNAYGLYQATLFLEGRSVPPDALARWTIVELRWPLLAEVLAARPHILQAPTDSQARNPAVPQSIWSLLDDEAVRAVLGMETPTDRPGLDEEAVRQIMGSGPLRHVGVSTAARTGK
jgi:hypothetical protein